MSTPSNWLHSTVVGDAVVFLKGIPPFQSLPEGELDALSRVMTLEFCPRDTVILRTGRTPGEALHVVQKGAVKLAFRAAVGKELTLDIRGEGEIFGLLSVMRREAASLDVIAVEDTFCYSIPAAEVQRLISSHAEVADFFLRTSITRYIQRSLGELRERARLVGEGERFLYSLTADEAAKDPAMLCPDSATVKEAAHMMSYTEARCLFVVGPDDRAMGIVTDRDFTEKVVAEGLPGDTPVTAIMNQPLLSLESGMPVFQALLMMLRHGIHHVLVTEDGFPRSVLTNHDLLLLQGSSPLNIARHFDQQKTVTSLAEAGKRVADLLHQLLREGTKATHITRVVAEISDRLVSKILQLGEAALGPPPAPYCWVALGSEGRAELTFQTDQDNALIYADAAAGDAAAEEYFSRLALFARDALVECGHPLCQNDYMVTNPRWRQPLAGWKKMFAGWMDDVQFRDVEQSMILFDMRAVAGDASLFEELATHNRALLADAELFRSALAYVSIESRAPIGFLHQSLVDHKGEHKDLLDLKVSGTEPIVNAVRLLALNAGIRSTNTMERLAALDTVPGHDHALLMDLREAFEFVLMLRLESQLAQARVGDKVDNLIRPGALTQLQKNSLKETFQTAGRVQALIDAKFRSGVWAHLAR